MEPISSNLDETPNQPHILTPLPTRFAELVNLLQINLRGDAASLLPQDARIICEVVSRRLKHWETGLELIRPDSRAPASEVLGILEELDDEGLRKIRRGICDAFDGIENVLTSYFGKNATKFPLLPATKAQATDKTKTDMLKIERYFETLNDLVDELQKYLAKLKLQEGSTDIKEVDTKEPEPQRQVQQAALVLTFGMSQSLHLIHVDWLTFATLRRWWCQEPF